MRETLEASWGKAQGRVSIWYRRAAGKQSPINAQRWFTYPSQFEQVLDFIDALDYDVYFSPPVYDEDSRTPEHAQWAQTIWCDADLCHPDNFRLPPSRILKTSVGNGDRYQCFWDLDAPVTAQEASAIAHKIAIAHKDQGADQSSWAANKLMRIPGTANTNWGDWVVQEMPASGEVYSVFDIEGAYEDIELPSGERAPARIRDPKPESSEPVVTPEGLPDYQATLDLIPASETRLYDLIFKVPPGGPEGWRSEQLWALLLDLCRFGMNLEQMLTIAWHAPTASKVRDDPRGLAWLQAQAEKAMLEVDDEKGRNAEPAPETKRSDFSILTPDERREFERRTTWDTEYVEWARTKINSEAFNKPYHDAMAWTILACAFGSAGYVPKKKGPMPLSLYVMPLGPSSSGKSEARDLGWSVIRKLYPGDSVDIGSGHSKNSLLEQLIARDGKVSLIHSDEAQGKFREMKTASWTNGIQEIWTDIHGGWIPSLGRVGKVELSKPDTRGVVVMFMMGTLTGMLEILDRDMFMSGYLARQVWFVADDLPVTKNSIAEEQAEEDDDTSYEGMPKYWASMFLNRRTKIRRGLPPGERQRPMRMTQEAMDRHTDMKWAVTQHYLGHGDDGIYTTAIRRFSDNVRKAATLLAMADGQRYVGLHHWIAAAGHAEQWLKSLEIVAEGISDTWFSKQLDDVEHFIAEHKDQERSVQSIYTRRKEPKRVTDDFLLNLMAQGRIVETRLNGANGPLYYQIKKKKEGTS